MQPSRLKFTKIYLALAEATQFFPEPRNLLLTRNIKLRCPFHSPKFPTTLKTNAVPPLRVKGLIVTSIIYPFNKFSGIISHPLVLMLCRIRCDAKVNLSLYRPGQALRALRSWGSQISRQSERDGSKVNSPTHRPPLPHRRSPVYSFLLESQATPRAIARPVFQCVRGFPMKNPNDTIGNRTRGLQT